MHTLPMIWAWMRPTSWSFMGEVGSGPSVRLAARHPVRALVLHAPIASGIRVLAPNWTNLCSPVNTFYCCDLFPNYRVASRVTCRPLLMHGTHDRSGGTAQLGGDPSPDGLTRRAEVRDVHYVRGAGHNDLVEADPRGYLQLLKEFLGSLNGGSRGGNEQRTGELQPSLL